MCMCVRCIYFVSVSTALEVDSRIVPRVCFFTIVPRVFVSMLLHKHKIITLSQGALIKIEWRGKFASYLFDYYLLQYIYLL